MGFGGELWGGVGWGGGMRVGPSPAAMAAAMHLLRRMSHSRTPLSTITRASSTTSAVQDKGGPEESGRGVPFPAKTSKNMPDPPVLPLATPPPAAPGVAGMDFPSLGFVPGPVPERALPPSSSSWERWVEVLHLTPA